MNSHFYEREQRIMLERPSFKPHFTVEVLEGEGVLILTEKSHYIFSGKLYELVASYIDGSRSTSDIVQKLDGKASAKEVEDTVNELASRGVLIESDDTIAQSEAAFWWMQDIDPKNALHRLEETGISLDVFGNISKDSFISSLETLHVRVDEESTFGVVLTDDYLSSGLAVYNEESLNTDRSWMLIKPVGSEIWIGPIFVPGRTGCWECMAERLRANRSAEVLLRNKRKNAVEPAVSSRAFTTATLNIAWGLAATKIAKWIVQQELLELQGHILTQDLLTGQTRTHSLMWRPQCSACGDADPQLRRDAFPIVLQSTKKSFTVDGGHRATYPEATLEKYTHHISPITGVIKKLDRYGLSSSGALHVYGASVNCVAGNGSIRSLADIMSSSGKGASDLQARTSALCESLERYSGVFRGDEPRFSSRLNQVGDAAIHPYRCIHFSEKQYRNRDKWNAKSDSHLFVPHLFNEDSEIDWTPAWSLTHNKTRFLPTAFCYYMYSSRDRDKTFCSADSNGNAAGNTLEEAILQGFLELVERDSIAIWWYNRIRRPAVDWMSFDLPYLEEVWQYHEQQNRELWILDITSDLQIPSFVALSRKTVGPEERIIAGFGAHLDARIAILRAVTEVNQGMVWTAEIGNYSQPGRKYYESLEMEVDLRTVTSKDIPHVVPDANAAPRRASDFPRLWADDLKDDVLICKNIVEKEGMEMLILDQTRADIGLPVVKVIVPELRHFWPRFAPGRLYDVPVKLGWLSQPLTEEQLNPIIIVP